MNDPNPMEPAKLSRATVCFGLSLAVASVANGLLVVAKEKLPGVMAFMQKITGHHWITHAAALLLLFLVLGCFFGSLNQGRGVYMTARRLNKVIVTGVALGFFIITGFYLLVD